MSDESPVNEVITSLAQSSTSRLGEHSPADINSVKGDSLHLHKEVVAEESSSTDTPDLEPTPIPIQVTTYNAEPLATRYGKTFLVSVVLEDDPEEFPRKLIVAPRKLVPSSINNPVPERYYFISWEKNPEARVVCKGNSMLSAITDFMHVWNWDDANIPTIDKAHSNEIPMHKNISA